MWWNRWIAWTKTKAARRLHELWNSSSSSNLHWSKEELELFMWAMLIEKDETPK